MKHDMNITNCTTTHMGIDLYYKTMMRLTCSLLSLGDRVLKTLSQDSVFEKVKEDSVFIPQIFFRCLSHYQNCVIDDSTVSKGLTGY